MRQIIFHPKLHKFDTCAEFAREFGLGEGDLVLTNKYIYEPFFGTLGISPSVMFQEEYGAGEPTDVMVDAIIADAVKTGCQRVVAIGGGTVIDIAKVLAVTGGEPVDTLYEDTGGLTKRRELILLPTTCGTGSEVTSISIINRTRIGTKMGLTGEAMFADHAVLVPELLKSLPFGVFAASSIDALVHAVESSLSPKATPFTKLFSYQAIETIVTNYQKIVRDGRECLPALMEEFLIASCYAGLAFGTAGCAAVHAMSYPLGAACHVAHGESNYAMFTGVLKNYMELKRDGEIAVMNARLAGLLDCGAEQVYDKLEELLNQLLPKKALREYGVTREDIDTFTKAVMTTQGRLMDNSFVPLDAERVRKIYTELY